MQHTQGAQTNAASTVLSVAVLFFREISSFAVRDRLLFFGLFHSACDRKRAWERQ